MGIVIAIIIVLSGVSIGSESALPGNVLYPVKIYVNENVRSALALTDSSQANLSVYLADRRLEEAEKLAVQSKLDAKVRTQLETNFKLHADRAQALIEKLDANVGADVGANLATSLKTHERILLNIASSQTGEDKTEVQKLVSKVETEVNDSDRAEADAEARIKVAGQSNVQTAAEGKMTAAQHKIDEVKDFIAAQASRLGAAATVQANARLQLAQDTFAQGQARLNAKAYSDAFVLFQKAQQIAQEAKLLIEAKDELEIDTESESKSSASPSSGADYGNSEHARVKVKIDLGL